MCRRTQPAGHTQVATPVPHTPVDPSHVAPRCARWRQRRAGRRPGRSGRGSGVQRRRHAPEPRTVIRFVLRPLIYEPNPRGKSRLLRTCHAASGRIEQPARFHCYVCGASVHLSMGHPGSSDGFSCRWSGQVVLASSFRSCSRSLARPRQRYLADRLRNAARA